jgi:hypothetical protein
MVFQRWWSLLAVMVLGMSGCGGPAEKDGTGRVMTESALGPAATVTYEFQDSSVPPPYHRSYGLTFDRSSARIVVDSYGDVLADRSAPMPEQVWEQVSRTFPEVRTLTVEVPDQGCAGGTGFALTVAEDGTKDGSQHYVLRGTACGGINSDVAAAVSEWVGPVRALFPPMDELAPEGE